MIAETWARVITRHQRFTLEDVGDLSKTIGSKADELSAKVTELKDDIDPLTAKITSIPGQLATKTKEEQQKGIAKMKELYAEVCKYQGSLAQILPTIEKSSTDAKDKVAKLNAELAANPAKATGEDGPKFQSYLQNMNQAIMTYTAAVTTASTYKDTTGICKMYGGAEAASRLFTKMNPMASSQLLGRS